VYRDLPNREAMFATPEYVFKDGTLVARAGKVVATPHGGIHFVAPDYDAGIEPYLRRYSMQHLALDFRNAAIGRDELCACCNGGRLLPVACAPLHPPAAP